MSEMKTKSQMFRLQKLHHDSGPATYMVQKRRFGMSALVDLVTYFSKWVDVVEVCTEVEARRIIAMKYYTYRQEFSGRVVKKETIKLEEKKDA